MMPTIRIDDEVWKYLQSKASPFEDSPNDVLRRELRIDGQATHQPVGSHKQNSTDLARSTRLNSTSEDYTYRSVSGFKLAGATYPARTFKDVLMGVVTQLERTYPIAFENAASQLRGKKRSYFSSDPKDLRHPERVPGSKLFVETNLNSNLIVTICRTLAERLGEAKGFAIV